MSERIAVEREVLDRPTGYASSANEQRWKAAVRHACAGVTLPGPARIQVEADFVHAVQQRGRREPNLDNLMESALDALEGVLGGRSGTGARVKADGVRVNRILAFKRHVRDGEQQDTRISSQSSRKSPLNLCGRP